MTQRKFNAVYFVAEDFVPSAFSCMNTFNGYAVFYDWFDAETGKPSCWRGGKVSGGFPTREAAQARCDEIQAHYDKHGWA